MNEPVERRLNFAFNVDLDITEADARTVGEAVRGLVVSPDVVRAISEPDRIIRVYIVLPDRARMMLEREEEEWRVCLPDSENEEWIGHAEWSQHRAASPTPEFEPSASAEELRAALYLAIDLARLWGLLAR